MEEKNTNTCICCNNDFPIKYFEFRKDTKKYRNVCRKCSKKYNILRIDKVQKINKLFSEGLKECGKCKNQLKLENFSKDKYTITGLTSWCKECKKKYQELNRNRIKNKRLETKYNITLEHYEDLLKKQNYRCAICKTNKPKGRNKKFHVDHDHETGKVRGLLCHHCNVALGSFFDSIDNLNKAIEYLKESL